MFEHASHNLSTRKIAQPHTVHRCAAASRSPSPYMRGFARTAKRALQPTTASAAALTKIQLNIKIAAHKLCRNFLIEKKKKLFLYFGIAHSLVSVVIQCKANPLLPSPYTLMYIRLGLINIPRLFLKSMGEPKISRKIFFLFQNLNLIKIKINVRKLEFH